jgi:uncharacterized membrane protein
MRQTTTDPIEQYLAQLAEELEALDPAEVRDIIAEVGSHLNEAAGADDEAARRYLADFGEPHALAAGILADRGLLPQPGEIPNAPGWRRVGANLADGLIAGLLLIVALPQAVAVTLFMASPFSHVEVRALLLLWTVVVVAAGWAVYYWRSHRGRGWSHGLALFGLRRIKSPGATRLVLAKHVTRNPPGVWPRVRGALAIFFAASVMGTIGYTYAYSPTHGSGASPAASEAAQSAQADTAYVLGTVSAFYRQMLTGAPMSALAANTDGRARQQLPAFVRQAKIDRASMYEIQPGAFLTYANASPHGSSIGQAAWQVDASTTVQVIEDGIGPRGPKRRVIEFIVQKHVPPAWYRSQIAQGDPQSTQAWSSENYKIISMKRTGE